GGPDPLEARASLGVGEPRVEGHRDGAELRQGMQEDDVIAAGLEQDRDAVAALRASQSPTFTGYRPWSAMDVKEKSEASMAIGWTASGTYTDIRYETGTGEAEGIAKLTICRPEVRNAFRPQTLFELSDAFDKARDDPSVGVIVLTGEGTEAFCSGGDQRIRGDSGYVASGATVGRFHVTDLHIQIRRLPKPVVAMVAGYAIGGGHVLHVVCDLTIAADNARFGQTGP